MDSDLSAQLLKDRILLPCRHGARFPKVPKLFGRISGDIILFVSSKRKFLEARNFVVILIFVRFTTIQKTSFTDYTRLSFTPHVVMLKPASKISSKHLSLQRHYHHLGKKKQADLFITLTKSLLRIAMPNDSGKTGKIRRLSTCYCHLSDKEKKYILE